ncbi:MAG: ribosome-associated translation inhibitor RaiA [Candidatus Pacebacteria bacterium]|nr:ribosome-associated translation inhibitor RaiA [Candidatus Paceibacterota bacterium]
MNINIKATNLDLTDAIRDYINKRLSGVDKFAKNGKILTRVEVSKTTNHHKKGDVFRAEFFVEIMGVEYYAFSEVDDLYAAIDATKADIFRQITNKKDRKNTLFKRGSISIKKMIKGISDRNPFTSKY